ncbi:biotin/lipoyl-binding protein, partial [Succinivibrio sp.]|uniref:biotin/lipoyl-binding protein n=1 Tax=Succinivibrio sp. TaxID=2053619 RepID=UPI0038698A2A
MYTAHGYVDLKASALSFERAGKIDSINVIEGQKVNKGDILAVLNSDELSHQLEITKAKCKAVSAKLSLYERGYRKEE